MTGKPQIKVLIGTDGQVNIDAEGFVGSACETATAYLEEALGGQAKKTLKKEHAMTRQVAKGTLLAKAYGGRAGA